MSDIAIQGAGVSIDDVQARPAWLDRLRRPPLDGWAAGPAPAGSAPNPNTWRLATAADVPSRHRRHHRRLVRPSARDPRLPGRATSGRTRSRPAAASSTTRRTSASRSRTRPARSTGWASSATRSVPIRSWCTSRRTSGSATTCRLAGWQRHLAERGLRHLRRVAVERAARASARPTTSSTSTPRSFRPTTRSGSLPIRRPGRPTSCSIRPCTSAVAMTLHALRLEVGDRDFFKILKTWPTVMAGKNVDTPTFIRLAERISGEQLDDLFETWLFTSRRCRRCRHSAAPPRPARRGRRQRRCPPSPAPRCCAGVSPRSDVGLG